MTPEQMDDALLRAIAAGRRGPMAKVAPSDRRILKAAKAARDHARLVSPEQEDAISDSRQPEDGPPPGRWPR